MPHWEEARGKPKKTFTQYRWTDTVIEGWVLVEDKSGMLDEHGKSKVCVGCGCCGVWVGCGCVGVR